MKCLTISMNQDIIVEILEKGKKAREYLVWKTTARQNRVRVYQSEKQEKRTCQSLMENPKESIVSRRSALKIRVVYLQEKGIGNLSGTANNSSLDFNLEIFLYLKIRRKGNEAVYFIQEICIQWLEQAKTDCFKTKKIRKIKEKKKYENKSEL